MEDVGIEAPEVKEEEEFDELEESDGSGVAKSSFVRKLFELVNNEPDDIVGFIEDGTAFEVLSCAKWGIQASQERRTRSYILS
mgnify:FL=1|jgi:hypothetical protein